MRGTSTVPGWRRWAWRIALALAGGLLLGLVVVWLAWHYVPTWYDPAQLSDDDLPRVRAALPATIQEFTDRLVAGEAFEFKLSARAINEWIAGRASIWPEWHRALPEWLRHPVLAFENDRIILAARVQRGRWQAIVSVHLTVAVQGNDLVIRLVKTAVGALSAPMRPVIQALRAPISELAGAGDDLPRYVRDLVQAVDWAEPDQALRDGVHVENRFIWPNGERRFRITNLQADGGWLTLSVEPL